MPEGPLKVVIGIDADKYLEALDVVKSRMVFLSGRVSVEFRPRYWTVFAAGVIWGALLGIVFIIGFIDLMRIQP